MIKKIGIKNFKSVVDLTMELGRFNVVIGSNGCGKTNILEAITLASAASQNKLDNEFLGTRLRNVPAPYMFSAFEDIEDVNNAKITIEDVVTESFLFKNENNVLIADTECEYPEILNDSNFLEIVSILKAHIKSIEEQTQELKNYNDLLSEVNKKHKNEKLADSIRDFNVQLIEANERTEKIKSILDNDGNIVAKKHGMDLPLVQNTLNGFIIFSPEESNLRKFSDDSYILPLGRKGEGLFQYLKYLVENRNTEVIESINNGLFLLDWFDGFSIPNDLMSTEYRLSIGDKYLKDSLHNFDQRSTNEGFLYLLFYLTLFNSKETPKFFGIDNIEASFNPRLCTKLTEELVGLSKKNDKQVIVTTHNPYILDGLDLSDDEVRLFVARRDIDGHTKIERIQYREERKMPLSELWMSGLIGGLPENF